MPVIQVIVILIVIGVLLWLVNTYLAQYMSPAIVKLINVVTIIFVILWLLSLFLGAFSWTGGPYIGRHHP